jgi:hypothetical protein
MNDPDWGSYVTSVEVGQRRGPATGASTRSYGLLAIWTAADSEARDARLPLSAEFGRGKQRADVAARIRDQVVSW